MIFKRETNKNEKHRSGIVQKWDIQMVANNVGRAGTQTKGQELYENSMITPLGMRLGACASLMIA